MKKQRKTVSKCPTRIKACLRPMAALTLAMTAISSAAQAQGIVAGAGRISDTIIQLINIAFPVACGLALIAVIWFVFTKNPQWKDYTVGLFIGLLLWGATLLIRMKSSATSMAGISSLPLAVVQKTGAGKVSNSNQTVIRL